MDDQRGGRESCESSVNMREGERESVKKMMRKNFEGKEFEG